MELMPLTYNSGANVILRGGTFSDLSGNGNVVTNSSTGLTTDHLGRANKAFDFGASANIAITHSPSTVFTTELSVFGGIKENTFVSARYFWQRWASGKQQFATGFIADGWRVYVSQAGNNNGKAYTIPIDKTATNFLGFTFNNGILRLFVNDTEPTPTKVVDNVMTELFNADTAINLNAGALPGTIMTMGNLYIKNKHFHNLKEQVFIKNGETV